LSEDTFTKDNRHWLEPYLRDIQQRMGLSHWRLELKDGWPEEGSKTAVACVWRNTNQASADLYFRDPEGDWNQLLASIVHELVHVHTRDWDEATDAAREHLTVPTWTMYNHRLVQEMEQAVDAISWAWAQSLPMPKPVDKIKRTKAT
jgi:hypothetical protein